MAEVRQRRWQFSLAGLLWLMLYVAVLSGLWSNAPQLAVLAAGVAPSFVLSWRLARAIRRRARWQWLAVGLVFSLLISYLVSVGPALAFTQTRPHLDPLFDVVYWPLEKLCAQDVVFRAVNWYLRFWRIAID